MPLKRKTIRKPKAVPLDLAKYQVGKTNSCLNLIFKGATRRYDWMKDAPVVHPSFAAFNSTTNGGAIADVERDMHNQNDSTGASLVGVSRDGYGKGETNCEPGSVTFSHTIKDAQPTVAHATNAGEGQVITAAVSRKNSANENDVEIISSDDDEVQILSPIITRAKSIASRMHSLYSDGSPSDTVVTASHKRKATGEILDSVYAGDATSWNIARKRQQKSEYPASAALTATPVDTQTGAKKYSPAPSADDTRWNIWSVGNLSGKFGKIGFKLDVLREVLKQCDRAAGFKVLTRVNFTSEKLIKEVLEWRNSIVSGGCAPSMWDEEKPWWVWMPEDGSGVEMGPAAEPKISDPSPRLPKGRTKRGYRARKRNVKDREPRGKNAQAASEGTDDLESWLDYELTAVEDPGETLTSETKEGGEDDEVDLELLLDLELALQAELDQAPVLGNKCGGEKDIGTEGENDDPSEARLGGIDETDASATEDECDVEESEVSEEE